MIFLTELFLRDIYSTARIFQELFKSEENVIKHMPCGKNINHDVGQIISNCFQHGMSPENDFENCFNSDVSIISLNSPNLSILPLLFASHTNYFCKKKKKKIQVLSKTFSFFAT